MTEAEWRDFARKRVEALAAAEADERAAAVTPTAFTQEHAAEQLRSEEFEGTSVLWAAGQPRLPETVAGWR